MIQSLEDSTPDSYFDLLHPDYIFVRHQSGEEVFKEDWKPNVTGMFNAMKEGNLTWSDNRYLYENLEVFQTALKKQLWQSIL